MNGKRETIMPQMADLTGSNTLASPAPPGDAGERYLIPGRPDPALLKSLFSGQN